VRSLEHNKTSSSYLALIVYSCGAASYILAPRGLRPGHTILSSDFAKPKLGYRMLLANIPFNIKIHNIENRPRCGGCFIRSAGNWAKILEKSNFSALIMFKNGQKKKLSLECAASIGVVSNLKHNKSTIKTKAGDSRKRGRRP
jgi:large subunit ribosomal protein L2